MTHSPSSKCPERRSSRKLTVIGDLTAALRALDIETVGESSACGAVEVTGLDKDVALRPTVEEAHESRTNGGT
ncbi:hypothetical protein ACFYT3_13705 [Nocardia amikacinitolerans]|uniref:hypothetical protein n=1 Tax=Nocardia amikacinitolerans TaxID=756689 RepID=UPI0036A51F71